MSLGRFYFDHVISPKDAKRMAAQREPSGVKRFVDIPYVNDSNRYHLLDVYRPEEAEGKLPVIFDIHGGGWYYGDKELNRRYCLYLALNGFAVVNISYRLCPEVTLKEQLSDCFSAMNFVPELAERCGLDLDNIFVTGDSAGGHLAALAVAASKSPQLQSFYGVQGGLEFNAAGFVCAAFDPGRIARLAVGPLYFNGIYGKGYRKTEFSWYADFENHVPADMIPSIIITSDADMLRGQNRRTYEKLRALGFSTELICAPQKAQDGRKFDHVFNVLYPEWPESEKINARMCNFFMEHKK